MKRLKVLILTAVCMSPSFAGAQLPAPTVEEAAKKAAAAEQKAAGEEAAKAALAKAQDRVAGRYRAAHPHAPRAVPVAAAGK